MNMKQVALAKLKDRSTLKESYTSIRHTTEDLVQPLEIEDYIVQSAKHISPPKWHLAHTTWFFEAFVLQPYKEYTVFNRDFEFILNSYYEDLGQFLERDFRGAVSRPNVKVILDYRKYVDDQVLSLIDSISAEKWIEVSDLIELGLHHEQQHHEGLLADIKFNFWMNPFHPAYVPAVEQSLDNSVESAKTEWIKFPGGLVEIGYEGNGFSFDNETPRHKTWLAPYQLSAQLVTNADMLQFIEQGGYQTHEYWLSDGWDIVQEKNWQAPLYWQKKEGIWHEFTLSGLKPVHEAEPVCHASFYEAYAFAKWAGKRLPTEAEWEHAVTSLNIPVEGNFMEKGFYHPVPRQDHTFDLMQVYGDVWEWTMSAYTPYPGSKPLDGAASEYNHKFMFNKMVLKGGSCATPSSHLRPTYRNYFPLDCRKQCSGIRLADDV